MRRVRHRYGLAQQRVVRVLRIGAEVDVDEMVAVQPRGVGGVRDMVFGVVLVGLAAIVVLALAGRSDIAESVVALLLIPVALLAGSEALFRYLTR